MAEGSEFSSRIPLPGEDIQEYNKQETERLLVQAGLIRAKYQRDPKLADKLPKIMKEYNDVLNTHCALMNATKMETKLTLDDLRREYMELVELDRKDGIGISHSTQLDITDPNDPTIRQIQLEAQATAKEFFSIDNKILGDNVKEFRKAGEEAYCNFISGSLKLKGDPASLKIFAKFLSYLVLEKGEGRGEKLENFVNVLEKDSPEILKTLQENWGEGKVINLNLRPLNNINKKFTPNYQFKALGEPIRKIMKFKTNEMKKNVVKNVKIMRAIEGKEGKQEKKYEDFLKKVDSIPDDSPNSISDIQEAIRNILGITDPVKINEIYSRISQERLDRSANDLQARLKVMSTGDKARKSLYKYGGALKRLQKSDLKTSEQDREEVSTFTKLALKEAEESGDGELLKIAKKAETTLVLFDQRMAGKAAEANPDTLAILISNAGNKKDNEVILASVKPSIENEGLKLRLKDDPKTKGVIESLNLGVNSIDELLNNEELLNEAITKLSNKSDKTLEEQELLRSLQKFGKNRKEEKRQFVIATNNLSKDQIDDYEQKGKSLEDFYDKSKKSYEIKSARENGIAFSDSSKAEKTLSEAKIGDVISVGALPADATIVKRAENRFELKLFDKTYEYSKEEIPQIGASIEYINSLGLGFLLQDLKQVEKLFNNNSVKAGASKDGFSFNLSDKNGFSREEKLIFLKTLGIALFGKEEMEKAASPEAMELIFKQAHNNNKIGSIAREKKILDEGGDLKFEILSGLIKG